MSAARIGKMLVAASLGVATLVGCANSGASSAPVIQPSAAPSTAKPTPPVVTAAINAHTKAGAAAFTEYWFALLSYGVQTGDVKLLQAASDPQCQVCGNAITTIQNNYNDGGSLQGGLYTVRDANPYEDFAGQVMSVAVSYDRSPRYGTSPLGVSRGRLDGKSFADADVRVRWNGSGWRLRGIDAAEQLV